MATMRAARWYAHHDVRVENIPPPTPKANDVLVAIEWCGICGSDLHEYEYGPIAIPQPGQPNVQTGDLPPITMGHEFCGRVIKVPEGSSLKEGQAVMVDPRLYCRACSNCKNSATNSCENWGFMGFSGGGGGGFSEVAAVDESMCYPVPNDSLEFASLIEPLCVARHSLRVAGAAVKDIENDAFLILGGGPIGIAMILILKSKGAKNVFVTEPSPTRKASAAKLADRVFNPITEKIGQEIRAITNGKGVAVAFDCAGIQSGMNDGFDALGHGGTYVNIAAWGKDWLPPQQPMIMKELSLKGSMAYVEADFEDVVQTFIDGKYNGLEQLVTSRILLEDLVKGGFEELIENKEKHIKIMVTPKKNLLKTS